MNFLHPRKEFFFRVIVRYRKSLSYHKIFKTPHLRKLFSENALISFSTKVFLKTSMMIVSFRVIREVFQGLFQKPIVRELDDDSGYYLSRRMRLLPPKLSSLRKSSGVMNFFDGRSFGQFALPEQLILSIGTVLSEICKNATL